MIRTSTLRYYIVFIAGLSLLFAWQKAFTNATSSTGGGYADAPYESNCTSCHTGSTIISPSSAIKMTLNGSTSLFYEPDSTYVVAVSVTKSGINKWGYQATVLKDSDSTFVGTFSSINTATSITSATVSGKQRYYAEHTSTSTSGTGGRSWSFQWKAPHTYVGNVTFYISACGANGNGAQTGDQIYSNSFKIPLQPNTPVPGFKWTPINPCEGDTVYFTDTSKRTPTSWNWSFTGGTPSSSTLKNPKVVWKVWGGKKMAFTATNKDGTSVPVNKIVNVNIKPSDTIYRSRPLEFCKGDSTVLKAFAAEQYKWNTGLAKDTLQVLTIKKTGVYYCTVTSNGCSTHSKNISVNAHPKPTNILSRIKGADTLCEGDTVKFNLVASGKTWNYYINKTLFSNNSKTLTLSTLTGTKNKIYTIVIDTLGCKSDSSTFYNEAVRVHLPATVITAGKSTTESVTATWKAVAGAIGYDISIDSGKTWHPIGKSLSYTNTGMSPNTSITIMVRAEDNAPCTLGKEASITLKTIECAKITYNLMTDSLVCPKSISTVNFSNINANHYSISYNNVAKRDTLYSLYMLKDTVLHFKITDSLRLNCGSLSLDVPLHIIKYDSLKISTPQTTYCGNHGPITIKGNGIFEEYDVYKNGIRVQKSITNTFSTSNFNDGDRIVMVGYYRECQSDSSNAIILHKFDAPIASFTYKNTDHGIFNFTDKSQTGYSRVWRFGDGGTDTSANPSHTYTTNKIFTVWLVVTGPGGCKDSISRTLTTTGIATGSIDPESLTVQPNPFNSRITVNFYSKKTDLLTITLTDLQGRTIKNFAPQHIIPGNNEINLSVADINPGEYVIRMGTGNDMISRRLVKE